MLNLQHTLVINTELTTLSLYPSLIDVSTPSYTTLYGGYLGLLRLICCHYYIVLLVWSGQSVSCDNFLSNLIAVLFAIK